MKTQQTITRAAELNIIIVCIHSDGFLPNPNMKFILEEFLNFCEFYGTLVPSFMVNIARMQKENVKKQLSLPSWQATS